MPPRTYPNRFIENEPESELDVEVSVDEPESEPTIHIYPKEKRQINKIHCVPIDVLNSSPNLVKVPVQFLFLSGEFKMFVEYQEFVSDTVYKYFYHIKAYFLDDTKFCYCTLRCDDKIIDDAEEIIKYAGKIIKVIKTNIYNYVLKNWIPVEYLTAITLSKNPNAINYLKNKPTLIDWKMLSTNPNAIHILETDLANVDWRMLSKNPNAIHILELNQSCIKWKYLSENPNGIHLLISNRDKINYKYLSRNPKVLDILTILNLSLDNIDWKEFVSNPAITQILTEHNLPLYKHKIETGTEEEIEKNWFNLSSNPAAIKLLESSAYIKYVHRKGIILNPAAINLLMSNQSIFDEQYLSYNPSAFCLFSSETHKRHIIWKILARNPSALSLVQKNMNKPDILISLGSNPAIFDEICDHHKL